MYFVRMRQAMLLYFIEHVAHINSPDYHTAGDFVEENFHKMQIAYKIFFRECLIFIAGTTKLAFLLFAKMYVHIHDCYTVHVQMH